MSVALVLLVAALVAARYLFSVGSIAAQEAVLWLHGALFLLAMSYALKHGAHVRVDVFSQRWSAAHPGPGRVARDRLSAGAVLRVHAVGQP